MNATRDMALTSELDFFRGFDEKMSTQQFARCDANLRSFRSYKLDFVLFLFMICSVAANSSLESELHVQTEFHVCSFSSLGGEPDAPQKFRSNTSTL